eukprot:scaffold897_cov402-Prasinococcus_capsulatus_cf.AAC.37
MDAFGRAGNGAPGTGGRPVPGSHRSRRPWLLATVACVMLTADVSHTPFCLATDGSYPYGDHPFPNGTATNPIDALIQDSQGYNASSSPLCNLEVQSFYDLAFGLLWLSQIPSTVCPIAYFWVTNHLTYNATSFLEDALQHQLVKGASGDDATVLSTDEGDESNPFNHTTNIGNSDNGYIDQLGVLSKQEQADLMSLLSSNHRSWPWWQLHQVLLPTVEHGMCIQIRGLCNVTSSLEPPPLTPDGGVEPEYCLVDADELGGLFYVGDGGKLQLASVSLKGGSIYSHEEAEHGDRGGRRLAEVSGSTDPLPYHDYDTGDYGDEGSDEYEVTYTDDEGVAHSCFCDVDCVIYEDCCPDALFVRLCNATLLPEDVGGCLHVAAGGARITNEWEHVRFVECRVFGGNGGGAAFEVGSEASHWTDVRFENCLANSGYGGGAMLKGVHDKWSWIEFTACLSEWGGGGLALGDPNTNTSIYGSNGIANDWEHIHFHSCSAAFSVEEYTPDYVGGGGGAFFGIAQQWGNVTFDSCTSVGGKGSVFQSIAGGALFAATAESPSWVAVTFSKCTAGEDGTKLIPAGYGAGAVFEKDSEASFWEDVSFIDCIAYGETGEAGSAVFLGDALYWTNVKVKDCMAPTAGAGVFEGNISYWTNTYLDACDDSYRSRMKFQTPSPTDWSNVTIEGCCDEECQTTLCEPASSWVNYQYKECDGNLVDCVSEGEFVWNGSACHRVDIHVPSADFPPPPEPSPSGASSDWSPLMFVGLVCLVGGVVGLMFIGCRIARNRSRYANYDRMEDEKELSLRGTELPTLRSSSNSFSSFWDLEALDRGGLDGKNGGTLPSNQSTCAGATAGSVMPLHEIRIDEITDRVRVARGSAGDIFRGSWNGTRVALKVLSKIQLCAIEDDEETSLVMDGEHEDDCDDDFEQRRLAKQEELGRRLQDFYREAEMLKQLRHPNVSLTNDCTWSNERHVAP